MSNIKKAKTVRFHQYGDPEVLKIEELDIPEPAPHEIRLSVKAVGINRIDTAIRSGYMPMVSTFPSLIGSEAAGVIESVGADVTHVQAGDRVNVVPAFRPGDYGTYGELITLPGYAVHKISDSLSFEKAASIWGTFIIAYGLVIESAKLQTGEVVLLNAASSAAGLSAIQTINRVGGIPVALTTSENKKQALLEAGAKHVIVTSKESIIERVQEITEGKGANVILDAVGGPQFEQLVSVATEHARILSYGLLSAEPAVYPKEIVIEKAISIQGYNMSYLLVDPQRSAAAIKFIYEGFQNGFFDPVISKTFRLEDVVAAHRFVEQNTQVGKVVLTVQ